MQKARSSESERTFGISKNKTIHTQKFRGTCLPILSDSLPKAVSVFSKASHPPTVCSYGVIHPHRRHAVAALASAEQIKAVLAVDVGRRIAIFIELRGFLLRF